MDRFTFITRKQIVSEHHINQYIDQNAYQSNIFVISFFNCKGFYRFKTFLI